MIRSVGTVCLFVNDQEKAKEFYTNKLGFEIRQDVQNGPVRWLSVAPKDATTEVVLYKVDSNWEHYRQVVGKSQGITLNVSELHQLAKDLKAKGVRFALEPETQPWGNQAMILDDEGNGLVLFEARKW